MGQVKDNFAHLGESLPFQMQISKNKLNFKDKKGEIVRPVGQSVTYRYREFFIFVGGIGTGIGKNWYRKKVSEPVSEKFGTGKKYRYRYRKYLVSEKIIGKNLVPELIFFAKI